MGGLSSLFKGSSKTTTLEPMLTDEQKKAMGLLTQFGSTGQIGDFQAGQQYDLSGFNYGMTPAELTGGQLLEKNLAGGLPQGMTDAQSALTGMVNAKFNPDDPSSGFAAFQRQLARKTQGASDILARNAAMAGSRFGTQIGKDMTDLAAQQSDITASTLADLWRQTEANKLNAASGLNVLAQNQENINQSRIQQAFQMGEQQRNIQNQKAQAQYEEWQRARNERLASIDALSGVMNKNVDFGLKSYTQKSPSTFMKMFGEINPIAGSYNTAKYGYTTNQTSLSKSMEQLKKLASLGGA